MKKLDSKFKIAVLAGGIGSEREVSLQSGKYVSQALKQTGVNVVFWDITPDRLDILEDKSIDVFFIALHGDFGEDGQLQQILEDKSLVYTGSGPEASKRAFNKMIGKRAFAEAGVDTPRAIEFRGEDDFEQLKTGQQQPGDKYVIKPITQGSSVGITIAEEMKEVFIEAQKCLGEFGDCMIEQFIPGREITVGILCGKALPIIEVRPREKFYNYHAKYIDEQTQFLFDTITDKQLADKITSAAFDCFGVLGLMDFGRIDFILSSDEKIYVLEANTIPGLTTHSLLPKAAAKAGIPMSELCLRIIEVARQRKTAVTS